MPVIDRERPSPVGDNVCSVVFVLVGTISWVEVSATVCDSDLYLLRLSPLGESEGDMEGLEDGVSLAEALRDKESVCVSVAVSCWVTVTLALLGVRVMSPVTLVTFIVGENERDMDANTVTDSEPDGVGVGGGVIVLVEVGSLECESVVVSVTVRSELEDLVGEARLAVSVLVLVTEAKSDVADRLRVSCETVVSCVALRVAVIVAEATALNVSWVLVTLEVWDSEKVSVIDNCTTLCVGDSVRDVVLDVVSVKDTCVVIVTDVVGEGDSRVRLTVGVFEGV